MSRPSVPLQRKVSGPGSLTRSGRPALAPIPEASALTRKPSLTGPLDGALKAAQRTSKTSQRLVVLPTEPQTKPVPGELVNEANETLVTSKGEQEYKSVGERMTKAERQRAGYKRLTAYCVTESFRMKLLAEFLKREHNVQPRVFDEALYVVSLCRLQCLSVPTHLCRCTISHSCLAMIPT